MTGTMDGWAARIRGGGRAAASAITGTEARAGGTMTRRLVGTRTSLRVFLNSYLFGSKDGDDEEEEER